ncbi:nucleotide sugar dehydrogenase [Bacillus paralicheniformis]|uniref:nucleotide sugar dehydrogenase n=1 Tax=Bacillus paralicheniformis TaxID=1648923 RepID=UPI0024C1B707|nr:nucleotide sugar dehydrogenase [Bacillus paralicheniformis]WHX86976.1 nucleotide sugar dehydrogenase [Bacillus paralicheniformis]
MIFEELKTKFINKSANIGVIGLGYVGLPLALELAEVGFKVYGIDVDVNKINKLFKGHSYIQDIPSCKIKESIVEKNFFPTNDQSIIRKLNAIIICVPTPLTVNNEPDTTYITSAIYYIKKFMHEDLLIVLESTTYPGTTEDIIQKGIEELGYVVGENCFLCYSPERVDPGNLKYNTKNTPKILGGTTKKCEALGMLLYESFIDEVIPVSSPKIAEMSKLIENTFRSVNIAFINEMAVLAEKLKIDIWETIEAAATKPFGFMKFLPGPGIGGHCIPLDPMYLSWKAKESNFISKFIELAYETNKNMPKYIHDNISKALIEYGKIIKGSKILLLGIAYKADIDDLRESPGIELYELLKKSGALIDFNDPHVIEFEDKEGRLLISKPLNYDLFNHYDCVVLITDHSEYNCELILRNTKLIVDTRNFFKNYRSKKIFKFGSVFHEIKEKTKQ